MGDSKSLQEWWLSEINSSYSSYGRICQTDLILHLLLKFNEFGWELKEEYNKAGEKTKTPAVPVFNYWLKMLFQIFIFFVYFKFTESPPKKKTFSPQENFLSFIKRLKKPKILQIPWNLPV